MFISPKLSNLFDLVNHSADFELLFLTKSWIQVFYFFAEWNIFVLVRFFSYIILADKKSWLHNKVDS